MITVNPAGQLTQPDNLVFCNGASTTLITFSTNNTVGTTTYSWINDQTSIGLAANETGNIGIFTAVNNGTAPVIATIIVTPHFDYGGQICDGPTRTFTIQVDPTGDVDQPGNQVVCNNGSTTAVHFTTANTLGTTSYTWTNNTTSIGLPASGTGDISAFTATNNGTAPVVATITVTPHFSLVTCDGTPKTFTITVNPTGQVDDPGDQIVCNGANTTLVTFVTNNTVGSTTYSWTNNQPGIGLAASGTDVLTIPSFAAVNAGEVPVVATITVTPHFTYGATTCSGTPQTFTITVNPNPTISSAATKTICNNTGVNYTITSGTSGTTFKWTASMHTTPAGGIITGFTSCSSSSCGTGINHTLDNTGTSPGVVRYVITPSNPSGCAGTPFNFDVTVNPTPDVNVNPALQTVCNGTATSIALSTNITGATVTYAWTATQTTGTASGFSAGSGSTIAQTLSNTTTSPATVTYNIIPSIGDCAGTPINVVVTVNPAGQVNNPGNQVVCKGATTTAVSFTTNNTVGTTTYSWANSNTSIGLTGSGTGDISAFTTLNSGTAPIVATITVTPHFTYRSVTCDGTPQAFTITVNPTGQVNDPTDQVVCNAASTTLVHFTTGNTVGTTTYTWANNTTSIGLAASGSGDISSFTATNSTATPVVATITVTPHFTNDGTTCNGTPETFTITINPTPAVSSAATKVICNNTLVDYTITSATASTTFTWTASVQTIPAGGSITGFSNCASGCGTLINHSLNNNGTSTGVVRYVITPTGPNGCPGTPFNFDVTVNPTSTVVATPSAQTICNGSATSIALSTTTSGATVTYSWTAALTTGIASGFSAGSGSSIAQTIANTSNAPATVTYTITPLIGACAGTPSDVIVTINPSGQVNDPADQIVCNGALTSLVTFGTANSGGTTTYTWTNNTTSIGLAASGSGNIAAFTTINTGSAQVVATITVTPHFANGSVTCDGTPQTFTITVNPAGQLIDPADQVVCNGASTTLVTFDTNNSGGTTTYSWTNDQVSIGLAASGSDVLTIPSFTAANAGASPVVATITVTPHYQNGAATCNGTPQTFTITVNPSPTITSDATKTICNNTGVNYTITSATTGTTFKWTASLQAAPTDGTITGFSSCTSTCGTGINHTLVNTGTSPGVVRYVITPTGPTGCAGTAFNFDVTVNPTSDVVTTPSAETICGGGTTNIALSSHVTNATVTYSWTATLSSGTASGFSSGTGSPIAQTLTNSTTSPAIVTYTITPYIGLCAGTPSNVVVTVNPAAQVNLPGNQAVCNGTSTTAINFTTNNTGGTTYTYTWTNSNTSIGLDGSGTGNISAFVATNTGSSQQVATIEVTPHFTKNSVTCDGPSKSFTITVNPIPTAIATPASQEICSGSASGIALTSNVSGATFSWTVVQSGVTGATAGSGTSIAQTLTASGSSSGTATYTITPSANLCSGSVTTVVVTVSPITTSIAGPAQNLCNVTGTTLAGNQPVSPSEGLWTVTGPNSPTITSPTLYNSTVTGMIPGVYEFTWTIRNGVCTPSSTTVTVTISAPPTTAVAGTNQIHCGSTTPITVTMAGNAPVAGTGAWSVITTPAGALTPSITNPSLRTTEITNLGFVTPTNSVTYTFRWTISNGACTASTSDMTVTLDACCPVTVNENVSVCSGSSIDINVLNGDYSPAGYTLTLSETPVAGSLHGGTFVYKSGTTFTYTPDPSYTGSDVVTVKWCDNASTPCCTNDNINITVSPKANAGPDQTICNANITFLVGNDPLPGTASWSFVSGPVDPSLNIFPTTGNVVIVNNMVPSATPYVFRYTMVNSTCTTTDDVTYTNYHLPSAANAGADQKLCTSSPTTTLTGNTPVYGTGVWSQISKPSGGNNAIISTPAVATTTVSGLSAGIYTFAWTITNGTCGSVQDLVDVTVYPPCNVGAGIDAVICQGATHTLNSSSAVNCGPMSWGTNGDGFFSDPLALSPVYTPGPSDIANGSVILYLECQSCCGIPCPPGRD